MKTKLRSLAVSLFTASGEVAIFAVLTVVLAGSTTLVVARWICGALGAVGNFVLNRLWAFRAGDGSAQSQAGRFALIALTAVCLATAVWWLLFVTTGWDPRLVHLISMGLVWLSFTFPMLRGWVFSPQRS